MNVGSGPSVRYQEVLVGLSESKMCLNKRLRNHWLDYGSENVLEPFLSRWVVMASTHQNFSDVPSSRSEMSSGRMQTLRPLYLGSVDCYLSLPFKPFSSHSSGWWRRALHSRGGRGLLAE